MLMTYLSAGTSRGPNVSFSVRVAGEEKCATPMTPVSEQSARSCSVPPVESRYQIRWTLRRTCRPTVKTKTLKLVTTQQRC